MAIQAYEIHEPWPDGEVAGAVLVCTTSVSPIATPVFRDVDEAHAFAEWCERMRCDVRRMPPGELEAARDEWDARQERRAEAEPEPETE